MEKSFRVSRIQGNNLKQFIELIKIFNDVFEEPNTIASEAHLNKLLNSSDFYVIAAIKEGKIIGGLTAYELKQYYSKKSELYIYDIAVKTEFHNQGIGKKLIEFLKTYSIKNGIKGIFVEAHSEDEQAVKFYESTFGKSEKVDYFNLDLLK